MIGRYAREARVGRQLFRDVKMAARHAVRQSAIGNRVEKVVRRRGAGR
jgi:hypothetical protein